MSDSGADKGTGTQLVRAGRKPEWTGAVVNPPVWRASTHLYENCAALQEGTGSNEDGRFFYGRRGAPTQWALADALTKLEPGAFGTVLYPSGVAAISGALMSVVKPGDVMLISDNAYEPSRSMANGLFKRLGVETRFFDSLDLEAYAALFCENTKAVLIESPGSLTMEVCDTPAVAAIARDKGAVSMIDNTWATPLAFPALQHGCDMGIMALTKHVGGHSDLMMGSVSAGERWYKRLRQTAQTLGHVVSPDDAALALRGLRTLEIRLQKQTATALEVAKWLAARDDVAKVLCPMLPGSPTHDTWERDFTGGCGLFSFVLKGRDKSDRARLIDALELFGIGYSWGGFESLALPVNPAPFRTAASWPPGGYAAGDQYVIRLSIGLEDTGDLIADLAQAFDAMDQL